MIRNNFVVSPNVLSFFVVTLRREIGQGNDEVVTHTRIVLVSGQFKGDTSHSVGGRMLLINTDRRLRQNSQELGARNTKREVIRNEDLSIHPLT